MRSINSNYIIVLIFIIFLTFVGYIHRQNQLLDYKYKEMNSKRPSKNLKPILVNEETYNKSLSFNKTPEITKTEIRTDQTAALKDLLKKRSEQALETFRKEVFLDIKPPETFDYINLDLDNNMAGIYGLDPISNARVTGIAYAKDVPPDQVINLLKSNSDYLPNLANTKIKNVGPEIKLPSPSKNSGLNPGSLWNGTLSNGEEFAAVFLPREDKRGVYFLMLTGSPSYFKSNDGAFDSLYDNVKALPAPK